MGNPAEQLDDFRDEQTEGLGATSNPDAILDEAVDRRIISKETRDKIVKTNPDFGQFLRDAFDKQTEKQKERKEKVNPKIALRRAFVEVIHKNLLEDSEEVLNKPESNYRKTLDRALKIKPDDKLHYKDRAELYGLIAELRLLDSRDSVVKKEFEAEKKKASNEIAKLKRKNPKSPEEDLKLKEAQTRLETLKDHTPGSWFLAKTLNLVDPAELRKAKGEKDETAKKVKDAEAAQVYLTDKMQRTSIVANYEELTRILTPIENEKITLGKQGPIEFSKVPLGVAKKTLETESKQRISRGRRESSSQGGDIERQKEIAAYIGQIDALDSAARPFLESLKIFAKHVAITIEAGVIERPTSAKKDIKGILSDIPVRPDNVTCEKLKQIYDDLKPYYDELESKDPDDLKTKYNQNIPELQSKAAIAKRRFDTLKAKDNTDKVSDYDANVKVLTELISKNHPELPKIECQRWAEKVAKANNMDLQTDLDYRQLAERGRAELLPVLQIAGINWRLCRYQFKDAEGKVHKPFDGLKPEDFDAKNIQNLFDIGKLNAKNGFFALAAFELFDEKHFDKQNQPDQKDKISEQTTILRKNLMDSMAKELGVKDRMQESGVVAIVQDAFNEQLKLARATMKAYFDVCDKKVPEWQMYKIKQLKLKLGLLNQKLRTKQITHALYSKQRADIYEEAKKYNVENHIGISGPMAHLLFNRYSMWGYDSGRAVGSIVLRKMKSLGVTGVKLYGLGLWGGAKLVGAGAVQGAVLPVRALRYVPLTVLAPGRLVAQGIRRLRGRSLKEYKNTFRQQLRTHGTAAGEWFKKKGVDTWSGVTTKSGDTLKKEWGEEKWARPTYAERIAKDSSKNPETLAKEAEELGTKGNGEPIEVGSSTFIDLKPYQQKIAELDKMKSDSKAPEKAASAGDSAEDATAAAA